MIFVPIQLATEKLKKIEMSLQITISVSAHVTTHVTTHVTAIRV